MTDAQESLPDAESPPGDDEPAARRDPLPWIAGGLAVVVVALAVLVGVFWSGSRDDAQGRAREQAMAAARQAVVDFTSLGPKTIDRQFAAVDREATGDFKAQWDSDANRKAFRQRFQTQGVTTSTTVRASAVSCMAETCTAAAPQSTDRATVLVAADSQTKAGSQSNCVAFVTRVFLVKQNGRWLVANATPLGPTGQGVCA